MAHGGLKVESGNAVDEEELEVGQVSRGWDSEAARPGAGKHKPQGDQQVQPESSGGPTTPGAANSSFSVQIADSIRKPRRSNNSL
jgi:hypothetical protein